MTDGGKGGVDALGVGDSGARLLVEGDVEIDADEDALVDKIDSIERELVHFFVVVIALSSLGQCDVVGLTSDLVSKCAKNDKKESC